MLFQGNALMGSGYAGRFPALNDLNGGMNMQAMRIIDAQNRRNVFLNERACRIL